MSDTTLPQTLEAMRAATAARVAEEQAALAQAAAGAAGSAGEAGGSGTGAALTPELIRECLNRNEQGDGELFFLLHRGAYLYNTTSRGWLRWAGHAWEEDRGDSVLAAVSAVADIYYAEAGRVGLIAHELRGSNPKSDEAQDLEAYREQLYKRVRRLRSVAGMRNTVESARLAGGGIQCREESLDTHPHLLACPNGVLDLRTGELEPGRPGDLLAKSCATEWQGLQAPCPTWLKFLGEIQEGRTPVIDYLQRLLGYGLWGATKEHVFPIFGGAGRNGKGTIQNTVIGVLGPALAAAVPSQLLLDQGPNAKSSGAASPDIMQLKGLRFAFASETDKGRRFSSAQVKWLSGGDHLVGRRPFDRDQTTFAPSHLLILLTNNDPAAPADDFAFWERLRKIPFNLRYVRRKPVAEFEREADIKLEEKLLAEAPGILAWLVRGCLAWQAEGFCEPPLVVEATQSYRREEDVLQDFFDANVLQEPGGRVTASELYKSFCEWWEGFMGKKVPSQKTFGGWMRAREAEFPKRKDTDGRMYYANLVLVA